MPPRLPTRKHRVPPSSAPVRKRRADLALASAFTLALAGSTSCTTIPATGERKFVLLSEGQEASMGKQAAEEVTKGTPAYPNPALQSYVSELGLRLAKASESPELPWSFTVIDDGAVNAFALPGGYIFVTRGLLTHLSSEAQLAAVLGHEIGHVTGRHSALQMTKALPTQILLVGAMAISETARALAEPLAGVAQLVTLRWGRQAEEQADMLGFRYAGRTQFDLAEMPKVFETLKRVGDEASGGERLPTYMSTHPDPGERAKDAQQRLEQAKAQGQSLGTVVRRDEYLRLIDGMPFGENPRQGYFQGQTFNHPDMKFTFQLPDGWKGQNTAEAVLGQNDAKDAALQLTTAAKAEPAVALNTFLAKEVITQREPLPAGLVTSSPSASGRFVAKGEGGDLAGLVTFVTHEGHTLQILTMTKPDRLATLEPVFKRLHGSFARLTDPAALAVQPQKLKVQTVGAGKTAADLKRDSGSAAKVQTLAIINQVGESDPLPAGLVKTIVGAPPPGAK